MLEMSSRFTIGKRRMGRALREGEEYGYQNAQTTVIALEQVVLLWVAIQLGVEP